MYPSVVVPLLIERALDAYTVVKRHTKRSAFKPLAPDQTLATGNCSIASIVTTDGDTFPKDLPITVHRYREKQIY